MSQLVHANATLREHTDEIQMNMNESRKKTDSMDELGKSMDELGKSTDELGKRMDKLGNCHDDDRRHLQ